MTRRSFPAFSIALAALAFVAVAAPGFVDDDPPVRRWAESVWDAARSGDAERLERTFDALPPAEADPLGVQFRVAHERLREHRSAAEAARDDARATTIGEMREELAAGHQAAALRKAVIAQTYGRDMNEAFDDAEIMELVGWAERTAPEELGRRQWIEAQELFYLLKTFYEDTDRREAFERNEAALEEVNARVALLARYAPRVLHEMRAEYAERIGEEAFPEYNPVNEIDYRERLRDVDHLLLIGSLATAAEEHVETMGWRPLLEGGLDALEVLGTTGRLESVLPKLGDAAAVNRWVAALRQARADLDRQSDRDLDRRACSALLNRLVVENEASIELPLAMLIREFGDGAMARLDEYSDIVWPDELRRFEQQTAGDFVGVGILIRHSDKREITVVNPLEGTPAYLAGVRPDDVIVEVDGDSTSGWSLNDAVDKITGRKGSTVTLSLRRTGEEELVTIPIVRDVIKIHSVKGWEKVDVKEDGDPIWSWWVDPDARIAYIRLTQFTNASVEDLLDAWDEVIADARPTGLVLDLRHNPGGLLSAAVQISNLFVESGMIVSGEDKDQHRVWRQRAQRQYAQLAGVPTVVLVNRGSASASEIVAGCLQAHGAAIVLGERTFGKGSVQTVHHVAPQGRLKLTTQYYRLPSSDGGLTPGRLVHKRPRATEWGVDPDIEVVMTVQQVSEAINLRQAAEMVDPNLDGEGVGDADGAERANVRDLIDKGIDPQLQTALLILQAQALARDDLIRHAARGS